MPPRKHKDGVHARGDRIDRSPGLVLVFGASGYIGSNLVARLAQSRCRVRASARNREVLRGRGWNGVELMQADALKPETLPPVLSGVDVAYYLVHSMASGPHFADLDLEAAENFRLAAERAGVKRIVYLGGLIPSNPISEHLRSRRETGRRLNWYTLAPFHRLIFRGMARAISTRASTRKGRPGCLPRRES